MKVKVLSSMGSYSVNCYLAYEDGVAALIDSPCPAKYIFEALDELGLTLEAVLLTHGHIDHIGSLLEVATKTNCKVYVHENDLDKVTDDNLNLLKYFSPTASIRHYTGSIPVKDGDQIKVGNMIFDVILTDGHTSGSVCYKIEQALFTGDTLFADSIGRTDMPDGSFSRICKSIKKLCDLEGYYRVYPGHNQLTDLQTEKERNPFLRKGYYDFD